MIAIGFDLGHTLIHYGSIQLSWKSLYTQALQDVAHVCDVPLTPDMLAAAEDILSRYNTRLHPRTTEVTAGDIFREIFAVWLLGNEDELDAAIDAFFALPRQNTHAYPDAIMTLCALKDAGYAIGILSDLPYGMPPRYVHQAVAETGLLPYIDIVLTSVEVGYRKPHPTPFRRLAKALNTPIKELWYIGDEAKDIEGAKALGMTAVYVMRHDDGGYGEAYRISALNEILGLPGIVAGSSTCMG